MGVVVGFWLRRWLVILLSQPLRTGAGVNLLKSKWVLPIGVVILCVVTVLAGGVRRGQLASGVVTPENACFFNSRAPVIIHVVSVALFSILVAFQFVPVLRI